MRETFWHPYIFIFLAHPQKLFALTHRNGYKIMRKSRTKSIFKVIHTFNVKVEQIFRDLRFNVFSSLVFK